MADKGIVVSIPDKELNKFLSQMHRLNEKTRKRVSKALFGRALDIVKDAKIAAPVQTGRLRSSISILKSTSAFVQVGTNVEYAPFVELGTSKMAARPFLRPAHETAVKNLKSDIRKILKTP